MPRRLGLCALMFALSAAVGCGSSARDEIVVVGGQTPPPAFGPKAAAGKKAAVRTTGYQPSL